MKYDVAIIGTGPAGGVAAGVLARSGLRVLILESKKLPRLKPCGGLMPGGVLSLLDWDASELVRHRVNQLEYFHNFEHRHVNTLPNGELLLVDRATFDQGLIKRALETGSPDLRLWQQCTVKNVVETADHVEITGDGFSTVKANYVIAADGAVSRTARCLGLNSERVNGVTIDAELQVSDPCWEHFQDRVVFNYYCLPRGYGWIFPKARPVLSCGVGTWGGSTPVREALAHYLDNSIDSEDVITATHHGFPIPIYSGHSRIASKRVCLVGDAASLVNPVSGEGIRFAMWSGKIAADTVLELSLCESNRLDGILDCGRYQEKIYTTVTPNLDHTLRFAALPFTQAPDLYYQRFILQSNGNPHYT